MFKHRGWIAAALAAVLAVNPVGLASGQPSPPLRAPGLHAPLAGYATVSGQMQDLVRDDLLRRHMRLQRRLARLQEGRLGNRTLARARQLSAAQLEAANRRLRDRVSELDVPLSPVLRRIAQCESRGDPRAIGGGGLYRGAFQMTMSSWAAAGGRGDPVNAPLAEQYRRAAVLLARSGPGQWPVCA